MAREPKGPSDVPSIDSPARQTSMLTRPTLKRSDRFSDQDDLAPPKGQTRPIEKRFLLKVDGQFKRSFDSEEAAKAAGSAIKKAYPVVVVTIVDSQEHKTETIKA
ncbi:MAG TPA: hypothetical protein VFP60_14150 [Pseudolabrys sp.]|nr:hypothetical protein [Pseudolabrys sp.]